MNFYSGIDISPTDTTTSPDTWTRATRSWQNVMAAIRSVVATTEQSHMLAPAVNIGPSASSPSVDLLLASHPVKIYADPNTKLTVGADRTLSKSGQISIRVTISGRLVPL